MGVRIPSGVLTFTSEVCMVVLGLTVLLVILYGFYMKKKFSDIDEETSKVLNRVIEPVESPVIKDFLDISNAKDISLQVFDDMFDAGRIIIEKETYGFTRDFGVWVNSDAKFSIPRGATPAFNLIEDLGIGYATSESFMYEGTVFSKHTSKMFPDIDSLREYAKTMFAVFLVYEGVSPLDQNTKRYYIVGCHESDGVVPTHGL